MSRSSTQLSHQQRRREPSTTLPRTTCATPFGKSMPEPLSSGGGVSPGRAAAAHARARTLEHAVGGTPLLGCQHQLLQPSPAQAHSLLAHERLLRALHGGPHVGKLHGVGIFTALLHLRGKGRQTPVGTGWLREREPLLPPRARSGSAPPVGQKRGAYCGGRRGSRRCQVAAQCGARERATHLRMALINNALGPNTSATLGSSTSYAWGARRQDLSRC